MFLQTAAPPDALLDRIVAQVARHHATLPSITADENIKSDLMQHGIYRAHGTAQAILRVSAGEPGKQLNEARTYSAINGKPVSADKKSQVPFELNGAFSRMLDSFFIADRVACYTFITKPGQPSDGLVRIDFTNRLDMLPRCGKPGLGLQGFVRVDKVSAEVTHLEQTVTGTPPEVEHITSHVEIDFAPAVIGAETFWLPTLLRAEYDHGQGHFEARYSNFHRYTGSAKILPDTTVAEDADKP